MPFHTLFAALALTLVPALAQASCGIGKQQAQSCATGSTWDAASQTCVPQASS